MGIDEIRVLVQDEEKAQKLHNEINKLRRKLEDSWISRLVDSNI